jgi:hypothetical protein
MDTFRTRLLELIQKSRKACRLYASMGKHSGRGNSYAGDLTDLQAEEWRRVNVELATRLGESFDKPDQRKAAIEVVTARDTFLRELGLSRNELNQKKAELSMSSSREDFVVCAIASRELVVLKARCQALEAACHEIDQVIKRSKLEGISVELPQDAVEVSIEKEEPAPEPFKTKIIPLRKMIG